ncbi:MAG: polyisoprenoid-binding protein [Calditrichaeota bacterium]|nr:polyisoprenoid-binding protein [Calditrichota bacterium]
MQSKSLFLYLTLILFFAGSLMAGDKYDIDIAHSRVSFSVKHMVIATVTGKFNDFSGTIDYDDNDATKTRADVTINAASIDTDNEKRDNHLRSADFFDTENFKTITFKTDGVEKRGDNYVAVGNLTMHGVTKKIEIPFTVTGKIVDPWGNVRIGIEGSASLNRKDFGINWSKSMDNGGLVVSDKVKININLEAIQQK